MQTRYARDGRVISADANEAMAARAFQFIGLTMLRNQKYSFLLRDARAEQVVSIDLIVVNMVDYWSALLYFTGSREFNIWLRDQCKKVGLSLSQYGLRDESGHTTKLSSEEHLFELLGMPYVEPEARTHAPLARE
jgi:DNA polymerase/3'-5' exonuclease PolX